MSEELAMVSALARTLVEAHPPFVSTADRVWDAELWADLDRTGLTAIGDEPGTVEHSSAVVGILAGAAAAVPYAEHVVLARPAIVGAGLSLPPAAQPTSFAAGELVARPVGERRWLVSGTAPAPWLSVCDHVAVLARSEDGPVLAVAGVGQVSVRPGTNLAGEPRDTIVVDALELTGCHIARDAVPDLHRRHTLVRAVQIAGALHQIVLMSIRYATERRQFGRPIAAFQAVQFMLADMAEEATLVTTSVQAAIDGLAAGSPNADPLIWTAKVCAGQGATRVARQAHQIHGAIGFTQEHGLHHLTRRCWSWREEAGSELVHSRALGASLAHDRGPGGLWAQLAPLV